MEEVINHANNKMERPSRSTVRAKGRIGRKSPTRYSPSRRSPSRRSPSRRSPKRSPARSPGRSPTSARRKLPIRSSKYAKLSIPRLQFPIEQISEKKKEDNENNEGSVNMLSVQSRLKDIDVVSRRSTRLSSVLKTESEHKLIVLTRNIERAVSLPVERKSQLTDCTDGKERGYSVQRDQDLAKTVDHERSKWSDSIIKEKRKKEISLVNEPQEWGGWLGTFLLIFILPLSIIVPQLFCTKGKCTLAYLEISRDIQSYVNVDSLYAYASYLLFLAIVSVIPVGKCIDGEQSKIGRLQYRMNGLLCALLSLAAFNICAYKGFALSNFILENSVQLATSGWLIGVILAIFLYLKANKVPLACLNIHASTNSTIYNFWQGREINPRLGPLDIKIILLRASLIGSIAINWAVIVEALRNTEYSNIENLNKAALLVSSLQIFYVIDMFLFESTILTTFEVMYEGTGYMICVGHLLYPFLLSLSSRYALYERVQFSYFFILSIAGFITGYIVYRLSNSQKDEFRKNPLSPTLDHLETITTSRGKKLLISGLWGYVRHPNYLGDIIIHWSLASITMTNDILPYYAPFCCTLILMYRAIRDGTRCKARYGFAWEQYSARVKYMILNRIF